MANNKRNSSPRGKSKKSSNIGFAGLKRDFMLAVWALVVVGIIVLVCNYIIARNKVDSPTLAQLSAMELQKVTVPDSMPDFRIEYTGHAVYFNPEWHLPMAVAYELLNTEADGQLPRHKNFERDNTIAGCATPTDYTNSGYDRGHMAPAGDMKWDRQAMHDSFKMTNICPQNKSLNTGIWNQLEGLVRSWAKRDSALIVVCGPIVSQNDTMRIGKNGVLVPGAFFKAVLAPFANPQRAIGFIFSNRKCSGKLQKYATTIDEIERQTGLDLFYSLPDDEEAVLESHFNYDLWTQRK